MGTEETAITVNHTRAEPLEPAIPPVDAAATPRRRRLWTWLVIVALLIGAGVYVSGLLKPRASAVASASVISKEAKVVTITTARVTPRALQRTVPIVGTFYGMDEVAITPKVDGRIVKILKDVGDLVRPGDLLMEIEEVDYKLAADEAQRTLDLELARLGLKEPPDDKFDVRKLPAIVKAQSIEANAGTKRERVRSMGRAGAQEQWDQAETDYQIAKANYDLAVLEAETTLASIRLKQAMFATARQRLADAKVKVPIPSPDRLAEIRQSLSAKTTANESKNALPFDVSYVVASRMASEGEMMRATASAAVFKLVLDRPLKLQGSVPERHSAEVKVGQSVAIAVEAYPNESFQGGVSRVNPTVDRASRTFQVEVLVPNQDRRLRAGSFAKAAIATRTDGQALTVPEEAIVTYAGVVKIFVAREGHAVAVPVEVGTRIEIAQSPGHRQAWMEVFGPVKANEAVVISGHRELVDGAAITERSGK